MDLFEFPFLSNIWGTVSDWIIVIITTLTAVFLYKTLKSQYELSKRDYLRHVREVAPIISFEIQRISPFNGQILFKILNNPAYNLIIQNKSDNLIKFETFEQGKKLEAETFNKDLPMVIKFELNEVLEDNRTFEFEVNFEDSIGSKYFQEIKGTIKSGFGHQTPKRIN